MRLRVRVLRVVRNESKAPGGSNKGVRVWARSKHNLKGPSARKQYRLAARDLPPGGIPVNCHWSCFSGVAPGGR